MSFSLPPTALDRELVFEFFWKFSTFECALKHSGFLQNDKIAKADWTDFGRKISARLSTLMLESSDFSDAVRKIKDLSPQRQMCEGKKIKWDDVKQNANESDAAYALRLVSTVRNNLFHGGKYSDGATISQIVRDRNILKAALTILDGCYELHSEVKDWIEYSINDIAA